MITQISDLREFDLMPQKGIEAQKIRALYLAYGTDYDFCRFYRQGSSYLSLLDGAAVLYADDSADITEIAQFLMVSGCREVFCSTNAAAALAPLMNTSCTYVNLMRFCGQPYNAPLDTEPSLSDVYDIVREGFDIDFEPWYLDMSHRVRHGISQCRVLEEKAALVIQHDINGEALISQVATLKDHRGNGLASRLVRAAAHSLHPSEVYIICEDELVGFYRKCGFEESGKKCLIYCKP